MRVFEYFTLCEIAHNDFRKAVSQTNIINGFLACGLWYFRVDGVNYEALSESDFTNRKPKKTEREAYERYQDLVKDFMETRKVLKSDRLNLIHNFLI